MGKRQAAQIAALEKLLAQTEMERDRWKDETLRWRATRDRAPESLTDVARREFNDRWGWLLDLAGFGR